MNIKLYKSVFAFLSLSESTNIIETIQVLNSIQYLKFMIGQLPILTIKFIEIPNFKILMIHESCNHDISF